MAAQFVTVTAEDFAKKMAAAGFKETDDQYGEITYSRQHSDQRFTIKVYTSISRNGSKTRAVGTDAIRVVLLFTGTNGKTYPMAKSKPVHRCGTVDGVLERTLERARDMYRFANERLKVVARGGPLFPPKEMS